MTMTEQEQAAARMLELSRRTQMGDRETVIPEPFPAEIAPGVFWLGSCLRGNSPKGEVHTGVWTYLVIGTDKTLMYETGLPQSWEILEPVIEQVLGGRALDYIVPSHPEYPHSGNLPNLLDKYPGAVAIGDMRDYPLHYPDYADRMVETPAGEVVDLGGGYQVRLLEAVLRDMTNTVWAYEISQQVLFVSDGFAYLHRPDYVITGEEDLDIDQHLPGQCGLISGVGDTFPSLEDILHYCSMAFYWSRYRDDSDRNFDRLQDLLAENPTRILAPSHGNVTLDLDRVVPLAREAHRKAYIRTPVEAKASA